MAAKRIGILTGGGDVPGLNSVIKSVVYRAAEIGCEVIGIRRGWEGLTHVDLSDPASKTSYILPLDRNNTRTIDRTGGTFLHTSRTNPAKMKKLPPTLEGQKYQAKESTKKGLTSTLYDVTPAVLKNIETLGLGYLIAIGENFVQLLVVVRECAPRAFDHSADRIMPGSKWGIRSVVGHE